MYGSKGGFVVYCDGHVVWFDGSQPAKFLNWSGTGYTTNILEAVPNKTLFTCGDSYTKLDYKSEDDSQSLVILRHVGIGGD